eukprot:6917704-Prymnesium_polylepis.3
MAPRAIDHVKHRMANDRGSRAPGRVQCVHDCMCMACWAHENAEGVLDRQGYLVQVKSRHRDRQRRRPPADRPPGGRQIKPPRVLTVRRGSLQARTVTNRSRP